MKNITTLLNRYLGWGIITIFFTLPVIRLFSMQPLSTILSSPYSFFSFAGKASSLVGIVLISINFVLSTRHRLLEKVFYGLNEVYLAHHTIGSIGFVLILMHPIFLALRFVPDRLLDAASMLFPILTPPVDIALTLGVASLTGFILLLVITFFIKLPYELWKLTHKFLGLVFILGVIHSFTILSDISTDPTLKLFMMIVLGLGILSYIYYTFMGSIFIRRYPYLISKITDLNDSVVELTLTPKKHVVPFKPGQFIFLRLLDNTIGTEQHPFTISSAPGKGDNQEIKITVKKLGDYTSLLSHVQKGTEVEIEGAFGKFSYTHSQNKKQIWIAGGIGVTPFQSMAQDLADDRYEIDMFYVVKTRDDLIGMDALTSIANNEKLNFRIHPFITSELKGRISADYIEKALGGIHIHNTDIFLCGPVTMIKSLRKQFHDKGVKNMLIHSEEFSIV